MKKTITLLWITAILVTFSNLVRASHAMGGEITYTWISGNTYNVQFDFYRDCQGLPAPATFDLNVQSSCYPSSIVSLSRTSAAPVQVSSGCQMAITTCNGGSYLGIDKYSYAAIVQLSGTCADWMFSVTECCRSGIATNLANPSSEASFYSAMLNNSVVAGNNSPRLTVPPVFVLNAGTLNRYNNGALDDDRDSIVVKLTDALSANGTPVTYNSGYSATQPVTVNTTMNVDANSGEITVVPAQAEADAVAYRIEEYRNGVLVGYVVRDVLTTIVTGLNQRPELIWANNGTPAFTLQACAGDTLAISLSSFDADPTDSTDIEVISTDLGSGVTMNSFPFVTFTGAVRDSVLITAVTTAGMASSVPYKIFVKVSDHNCPYKAEQIYVLQVSLNSCTPPACVAGFVTGASGLNVSFVDQSTGIGATTTYSWSFGDGTSSTARFPQHTYSAPGTYTVCLSISGTNCTDQYCAQLLVDTNNNGACQAAFAKVQLAPFNVAVVDLSTGINLSYLWDFGDGTTSTQQYPSHAYASTGSYLLCLTVNNGLFGCSDTHCDTLTVDSRGNLIRSMTGFTVNVVSPNMLTGIDPVASSTAISVFPNPVVETMVIRRDGPGDATYKITDLLGSVVLTGNCSGESTSVSTAALPKGTYLLEVNEDSGSRSFRKIVKN